jgi:hypothetical protein
MPNEIDALHAASSSGREKKALADDRTRAKLLFCEGAIRLKDKGDGFTKVFPSFFEGFPLGVGARHLFREGDVPPVRILSKNRCEFVLHESSSCLNLAETR